MDIPIFNDTDRMVHHLMLHSCFLPDIGLLYGRTGIALALSDYSRHTGNHVYFDAASYLLDSVLKKINKGLPFSFSSGLSGIGWGIEYLIQEGFVEGEGVDICEEIDHKIMGFDPKRISDLSLENGIEGLLHYVIYHLQGAVRQVTELPFDEAYLSGLHAVCDTLKKQNMDKPIDSLLDIYLDFCKTRTVENYDAQTSDFAIVEPDGLKEKISSYPLGLKDGLAGMLLHTIKVK